MNLQKILDERVTISLKNTLLDFRFETLTYRVLVLTSLDKIESMMSSTYKNLQEVNKFKVIMAGKSRYFSGNEGYVENFQDDLHDSLKKPFILLNEIKNGYPLVNTCHARSRVHPYGLISFMGIEEKLKHWPFSLIYSRYFVTIIDRDNKELPHYQKVLSMQPNWDLKVQSKSHKKEYCSDFLSLSLDGFNRAVIFI